MADGFRRLILRPPTATPAQWSKLHDALVEATELQNRLALRSEHVLLFVGPLREDARGFCIEHEPAQPLSPSQLFDRQTPGATAQQVLASALALSDVLSNTHTRSGARLVLHGGLCPGVLLISPEGKLMVSDFGFAPSICRTLGVESYVNLSIGPRVDASGAWEVLDADIDNRDDRICAFIDPDKYGQGSLTTFEAGSDVIAAGILLYLFAEHVHPYLSFVPNAHRVVDIAQMMGSEVPIPFRRKDLRESDDLAIATCCALITAMLSLSPFDRPTASTLAKKLEPFKPPLPEIEAWLTHLEELLQRKAWDEVEIALASPACALPMEKWSPPQRARRASVETELKRQRTMAEIQADYRQADEWLVRMEEGVRTGHWDEAQRILDDKPPVEHWPDTTTTRLAAVTTALEEHERRCQEARDWLAALQTSFDLQDWCAVGQLLEEQPAADALTPEQVASVSAKARAYRQQGSAQTWCAELRQAYELQRWPEVGHLLEERPDRKDLSPEEAAFISVAGAGQVEYLRKLAEDEAANGKIVRQQDESRSWLEQAETAARMGHWVTALDVLAQPPRLEHWAPDVREKAAELAKSWRARLGEVVRSHRGTINEQLRQQAAEVVGDLVTQRCRGLTTLERVETTAEFGGWVNGGRASECRAHIAVGLRKEGARAAAEPMRSELHAALNETADRVQLTGELSEWRQRVADGLLRQLVGLQKAELRAFKRDLCAGLFPKANVQAELEQLQPRLPVRIELLGEGAAEAVFATELAWRPDTLSWAVVDPSALSARGLQVAIAGSQRLAQSELPLRCAVLRPYASRLSVDVEATTRIRPDELPRPLQYNVRVLVRTDPSAAPLLLPTLSARCEKVGHLVFDAGLDRLEARFNQWLTQLQEECRKSLVERLAERAQSTLRRVRVRSQPGRIKTPVDVVTFERVAKGAETIALRANWDAAALVYQLPPGWESTLTGVASPVAAGEPARVRPRRGRFRGLIAASVVAVLGAAAISGLYFSLQHGRGNGPPPPPVPPWYQREWTEVQRELLQAGYVASENEERDANTQYPLRLTAGKQVLLLVSIPPAAELWRELDELTNSVAAGAPDDSLRLASTLRSLCNQARETGRLFYIDANELEAADTFEDADRIAAEKPKRRLSRRSEWLLAVLDLRDRLPQDIFGGRREWCADDPEDADTTPGNWVCGGYTDHVLDRDVTIPAPPNNPGSLAELWQWLLNPLIIQRRAADFGDEHTGVRTILPILPELTPHPG